MFPEDTVTLPASLRKIREGPFAAHLKPATPSAQRLF